MTTTKLLSGVALAALLSGGALAQNASITQTTAGEFTDGMDFAAEYNGSIGAILEITHDANSADYDALGGTAVVDITITTTGGLVFGEIVDGGDVIAVGGGAPAGDCAVAIQSGGGLGSTSVTFRHTGTFRDCAAADNEYSIDLTRAAASHSQDSGVTVAVTCNSDCGTFTNESQSFTLIDDTSAYPPADRAVTAAGTVTLDVDGIGPVGAKTLGNVDYGFTAAAIQTDGNGATMGGLAGIANADAVASAELEINFPGGDTGVASVSVDAGGAVACTEDAGAAVNTWSCALTPAQLIALDADGAVTFTPDNTDAIAQQTPTATLTVVSNADYSAPTGLSGALAPIEWDDGLTDTPIGSYDWVRFGAGGTESNFRIQFAGATAGAAAAAVTEVRVTVGQEGNGVPVGTHVLLPVADETGFQVQGGTITFNSRGLGAASGASGNADISVSIRTADADAGLVAGFEDLRQLVNRNPSSFVATPGLLVETP